jgi:hypothetical protein
MIWRFGLMEETIMGIDPSDGIGSLIYLEGDIHQGSLVM